MSTTATIGYIDTKSCGGEGKKLVKMILCWYDGYPDGLGACLLSWYNTYEEVERLVNMGEAEYVGQYLDKEEAETNPKRWNVAKDIHSKYHIFKDTICQFKMKDFNKDEPNIQKFWVMDIEELSRINNQDYNYLFIDGQWFVRKDIESFYRKLTHDMCDIKDEYVEEDIQPVSKIIRRKESSVDTLKKIFLKNKKICSNVEGVITSPIFDSSYFKVGQCVKVTVSESIRHKNISWINMPVLPFYAIVLDVLSTKLLITYYTPRSKKLVGRFAIPVEFVSDGTIKIEVIGG